MKQSAWGKVVKKLKAMFSLPNAGNFLHGFQYRYRNKWRNKWKNQWFCIRLHKPLESLRLIPFSSTNPWLPLPLQAKNKLEKAYVISNKTGFKASWPSVKTLRLSEETFWRFSGGCKCVRYHKVRISTLTLLCT